MPSSQEATTTWTEDDEAARGNRLEESRSEARGEEPSTPKWRQQQRLSIVVFRGDPVDATMFRHVGLLLEHLEEEEGIDGTLPHATITTHTTFLQVTGSAGGFERDESPAATCGDPRESELFAGVVHVATVPATGAADRRLRNAIWTTAVNNAEASWNSELGRGRVELVRGRRADLG